MNLSIVIVNYKTPQLLLQCVASLKKEAPALDDIIVIDNASGDTSLEQLKERFPDVRRIASRINAGFSRGVNWGITNARHDFILILNPDVIVKPGSIDHLMKIMRDEPYVGLVAPKLLQQDGSLQYSCCRFQTPLIIAYRRTVLGKTSHGKKRIAHFLMHDYDHGRARDVDWVIGGCMLVRRAAIEQVGLLDERFFMYCEDMDWCRRFWQAGWHVRYEPRAEMVHYHRRQSAARPGVFGLLNPLGRAHLVSGVKYFVKHIGNGKRLRRSQRMMRVS
jgi:GT2 family glycosyltransferase